MSSLKEKAMPMSCPECKGFGHYIIDDQRSQEKCDWCNGTGVINVVRLEDAEQALTELKKKLQQLLEEFPPLSLKTFGAWYLEVKKWKKKFEEWLKEEKAKA
jgi:hypothetical protein